MELMRKMSMVLTGALLIPALAMGSPWGKKKAAAKKENQKEVVKETDYSKLFKDKKCETRKGMLTLHLVDDAKVYFEFPLSLLGREMLLGSTVSEVSNNEHSVIGYKSKTPLHIKFEKANHQVNLCLVNCLYTAAEEDAGIQDAVRKSTLPSIFKTFKIAAYSPDSTAVVFDATDLFVDNITELDPFDPYSRYGMKPYQRNVSFEKSKSHLAGIKAFEDNISVKSYLTYNVDVTAQVGKASAVIEKSAAFTALMTRSFLLLPETPMRPRIADPRLNIFVTGKARFSSNDNKGTVPVYYARRWRLEPKDEAAYRRGELVEPKKPIVFYLDDNFPPIWKKYIRQGVEEWNAAFEKIGFRKVIRALDYPKDDPEFDPDNLKYSCLRYQPISIQNAMGPSWIDPRSGEIINASVMVYHDVIRLVNTWRFVQTAPSDPQVRTMELPEEVTGEALRYVIAHEIGHCLAFMHNMASSAAIPTDSLRSPSYTQQYGTTMSIMDYARFNYVAQPGDAERGVKLTPPHMGVHDYFAVKWLYTPLLDARTPEEEEETLNRWVKEKAGDPRFRYGKQQISSVLDPSAQSEDLGDDVVKSAAYGVKNLKYLMAHLNEWIGDKDRDFSWREHIYRQILQQYTLYLFHVYNVKGGVYLNERMAGDPRPSYEFVDGDQQRRAMKFLTEQLNDLEWLENPQVLQELPLLGHMSVRVQRLLVQLIMADRGTLSKVENPDPKAYTSEENHRDAFNCIFAATRQGRSLTDRERTNQNEYLNMMIMLSGLERDKQNREMALTDAEALARPEETEECCLGDSWNFEKISAAVERDQYMGFGFFRGIPEVQSPKHHIYYARIKEAQSLVRRMKNTGSQATRLHYEMLLHRLDGLLK